MFTIVVASTNPVKIAAAERGFARMFPDRAFIVRGVSVPSGVSDQPMSDAETRRGAVQRAHHARQSAPDADYWVGIEGGVEPEGDRLEAFAWIVVLGAERDGCSRTASFYLPDAVAALVREGVELGIADDRVFGRANSKQQNGSVGILTGDALDRTDYYAQAVVLALIPFRNPTMRFPGRGTP